MNFSDRAITQAITPEYLREMAGVEPEDAEPVLESVAKRFEASYPAVAMVTEDKRWGNSWAIRIIPKHNADRDAIKQGTQNLYHWLSDDDE